MTNEFSERPPYGLADLLAPEPPDDPFDRAALRQRRAVLNRNDTGRFDMDPSTLASIGAAFVPGSGFVDASGYMPDFQGGFEPSLEDNFRDGNYGTALLQGAGVIGDAFQNIPVLGTAFGTAFRAPRGIQRAVRASAGARRLAKKVPLFDRSLRRADGEVPQTDLHRGPPRDVPDDLAKLFATEGLEDEMLKIIENGRQLGATNWYNTEPIRQFFVKELGPDEGDKAFRKYIGYVAVTSAASDVGANVRNASYYSGMDIREGRVPAVDESMPKPYGHPSQHNHQIFAQKYFNGELDPVVYQKLTSFLENLAGNYAPVTVDRHALRLPAMLAKDRNFLTPYYKELVETGQVSMDELVNMPAAWRAPTAREYAALEQFYKRLAQRAGLPPAQAQAAAWVGGRELTGVRDNGLLSFIEHFEDRVHLTAKKNNIPVEEVLRRFVRGKVNLVSLDRKQTAVV